jgi:Zn-dependent protease
MFRHALRLPFKLLGIPVSLDTSFLLVLPLFAYLIGSQIPGYVALFQRVGVTIDGAALQHGATPYVLGLVGALGLFLSVLVHELGHAVVARIYGVEVREITLWFLGGVAQFTAMPRQRGAEAVVAIVGPITSSVLALLAGLSWRLAAGHDGALFVLTYLSVTNAGLALFNLLPALPLDGGRVLRSLLALALPHLRATRVAGVISTAIAVLLGIYGFFSLNLFLVVIAFFVYNAGRAETQAAIVNDAFEGFRVRDLMTPDPVTVGPDMPLAQFAQLMFFRRHTGYPVVDDAGRLLGFARLQDAREGDEGGAVADVMVRAETIAPDAEAKEALQRIGEGEIGRLAVVDGNGMLLGVLSKTDLIRRLREHGDPGAGPGGRGASALRG